MQGFEKINDKCQLTWCHGYKLLRSGVGLCYGNFASALPYSVASFFLYCAASFVETSSAMDYERINKVQTGLLSPKKLKLMLLGSNHSRRKEGNNFCAASPSKSMDTTFAKNSLMSDTTNAGEVNLKESEGSSATCFSLQKAAKERMSVDKGTKKSSIPSETCSQRRNGSDNLKFLNNSKVASQHAVHPVRRTVEDGSSFEHLDKQSKDACKNFEFHKGEGTGALTCPVIGAFSRTLPSKWNDAEKWIFGQQAMSLNRLRNSAPRIPSDDDSAGSCGRTASESAVKEKVASLSDKSIAETIDSSPPSSSVWEKFSFAPVRALQISEAFNRQNRSNLASGESNNIIPCKNTETNHSEFPASGQTFLGEKTGILSLKTVCMRDMGTEMTPMTSQEQSRIGTPIGPETPHRSCETSRMATPRRAPMPFPAKPAADDRAAAFSEEEFQSKTRKEIVDLGLKLGKMSIAAWARRDTMSNCTPYHKPVDVDQLKKVELVSRAAAWQEAENSKHMASFRRKVIKIQVWESNQKVKIKAELRKIEAKVEKMRAHTQLKTQLKMRNKVSRSKQQAKAKLVSAEAWKIRQERKTAKQAEILRQTGRIRMSSSCFLC